MNTTNTLLIILVVILVAFGVWYFTEQRSAPMPEENSVIDVDLNGGGTEDGTIGPGAGNY